MIGSRHINTSFHVPFLSTSAMRSAISLLVGFIPNDRITCLDQTWLSCSVQCADDEPDFIGIDASVAVLVEQIEHMSKFLNRERERMALGLSLRRLTFGFSRREGTLKGATSRESRTSTSFMGRQSYHCSVTQASGKATNCCMKD